MADSAAAVIGKSVQIRGEVKGSEDLVVDGHVEGTITLTESRLTIGPHANVTANVSARDVILLGQLNGDVRASGRVELRKGADLVGDIWAGQLSIEESAFFRGKVDLAQPGEKAAVPASGTSSAAKASSPDAPLFKDSTKK
jgi:cytoskeletal protein CcmA (bactofilin family)